MSENTLMTKSVEFEVNGEIVKLSGTIIKEYLVSGEAEVTDQEVVLFLNLCKFQKLNPFLNEAYLVKFKSKNGPDKPAQIIVSKEAFMKRAEAHPQYHGFEAGVIVERAEELVELEGAIKLPKDKLVGGWASVYRKDRDRPIKVKLSMAEFNKSQATWNAMPLTMIRKSAIVNALREAFPESLGAMYTEDDQQVNNNPIDVSEQVKATIEANANQELVDIQPMTQKKEVLEFKEVVDVDPEQESLFEELTTNAKEYTTSERGF